MPRKKIEKEPIEQILLSITEASKMLGVSHTTLYKLIREGLPSHKVGKRQMFLKEDILKWVQEH